MALDLTAIRRAFRTKLTSIPGLPPSSRRSWEGVKFDPPSPTNADPANTLWIRETLLTGSEQLAATDTIETRGEYRVDVFIGDGKGVEPAEELAKAIADEFTPKGGFTGTGVTIYVMSTQRRTPFITDDVWRMFPVVVSWGSFSPS
tara:strand:- start:2037 stop:2474 length:438 start_codon:yes stop_codon:yes gene_type:complete